MPGQAPHSLPSAFEEISTAAERACSRAQNAEDAAALAQTSAQVAQAAAQDAVRVAASGSNLSVDKSITNRTASSGSGQAHNNMPPYYTVGAQIRARRDVLMLELLGSE